MDHRTGPDDGYTLLEMLVVLTIMVAIGAALAGFGGGGTPAPTHARTTGDVAKALRKARAAAISGGVPIAMRLDPRNGGYGVDALASLPDGTALALRTQRAARSGGLPAIRFYPDGSASGGDLTLTSPSGAQSRIEVRWLTGRVVVLGPEASR